MANVLGSGQAETLIGSDNNDVINAFGGHDTIIGSDGKDRIDGGNGIDTIDYASVTDAIAVTLTTNKKAFVSFDGVDGDTLINVENIKGGSGDDYFVGDGKGNAFWGNAGDDYFVGSKGADTYYGGTGYDMVDYGAIQGDLLVKLTGEGLTLVSVNGGIQDRLSSIENIRGGVFDDKIVGNRADNNFIGNDGNDRLAGGHGGDRLVGGTGNDRLTGGADSDTFVFRSGDGVDVITDFDTSGSDHDVIDLRGVGVIDNFKDLMSMHVSQFNDSVLIYGQSGDAIELKQVELADLEKSDFLF